jgi:hypothetical protein
MKKGKNWAKGPSRLSQVVRSPRLQAIEDEVKALGLDERITHFIGIYLLREKLGHPSLTELAKDAGHGDHTNMLWALKKVQWTMEKDAEFAEKVRRML